MALEMARQLRAQGERVEAVVLVDTRAPGLALLALHRASDGMARLRRAPANERSDLRGRAEFMGRQLGRVVKRLSRLRHPGRPRTTAPARLAGPSEAYRRAIRRHLTAAYDGPVALFLADGFPADRPDLGWSRLLRRLEVVKIPGDHHSCVTRHVAVFGAQVEEVLRRLEGAAMIGHRGGPPGGHLEADGHN